MVKKKYSRKKTKRKKYQKKKKKTNLHRIYKRKNKTQRGGVRKGKRRKINEIDEFYIAETELESPFKSEPVKVFVKKSEFPVRNLMSDFNEVAPTPIDQWELDTLRDEPNRYTYIYALLFGDKIMQEDRHLRLTQKKFRIYVGKTTREDYFDRINQHIGGGGASDTTGKFIYAVKIIACVQFKDTVVVKKRKYKRDYLDQVAENKVRFNLIDELIPKFGRFVKYDYVVGGNYTTKGWFKQGFDYGTALNFLNLNQELSDQSVDPFSAHNFMDGCLYQYEGYQCFKITHIDPETQSKYKVLQYKVLQYNNDPVAP